VFLKENKYFITLNHKTILLNNMRRQRKRRNKFMGLALNSLGVIFSIVGLMFVFAKSFGELAIPAIHMMALMICIAATTLVIGVLGWLWAERSDW
jgi:hypothetical protein